MTVHEKSLITMLAVAAVFAGIAAPLALRKIGRNALYGFRTPRTLSDDFLWFEVNAAFGRAMLVASAVTTAFELALYQFRWFEGLASLRAALAGLIVPLVVAVLYALRVSSTLTPGGPSGPR